MESAEFSTPPRAPESPDKVFEHLAQKTLVLAEETRGRYGYSSDVGKYDSEKFMWGFASDQSLTAQRIRDAAEGKYINPYQGITVHFGGVSEKAREHHKLEGHTVAHALTDEFMRGLGFFPEGKGFLDLLKEGSLEEARSVSGNKTGDYIAKHPTLPVYAEFHTGAKDVQSQMLRIPEGFSIRYGQYTPPTHR